MVVLFCYFAMFMDSLSLFRRVTGFGSHLVAARSPSEYGWVNFEVNIPSPGSKGVTSGSLRGETLLIYITERGNQFALMAVTLRKLGPLYSKIRAL